LVSANRNLGQFRELLFAKESSGAIERYVTIRRFRLYRSVVHIAAKVRSPRALK
jgi:hypothetical protein